MRNCALSFQLSKLCYADMDHTNQDHTNKRSSDQSMSLSRRLLSTHWAVLFMFSSRSCWLHLLARGHFCCLAHERHGL